MAMELKPPPPNAYHGKTAIELLIEDLNTHAATQGYAMVKEPS